MQCELISYVFKKGKNNMANFKNIKKVMTLTMVGAIAFFGFSTAIMAAEVSEGESDANIEFTPGTGAPEVVDPTNPEQPYEPDPTDPTDTGDEPTGETGTLTLSDVSLYSIGVHTNVCNR